MLTAQSARPKAGGPASHCLTYRVNLKQSKTRMIHKDSDVGVSQEHAHLASWPYLPLSTEVRKTHEASPFEEEDTTQESQPVSLKMVFLNIYVLFLSQ